MSFSIFGVGNSPPDAGWVVGSAASSELSGAITALPYVDMFETDPLGTRVSTGSTADIVSNVQTGAENNSITWSAGTGWNGANELIIQPPTTSNQVDCGLAGNKALPGTSIRRLHISFICRWNALLAQAEDRTKFILAKLGEGGVVFDDPDFDPYSLGGTPRYNAQAFDSYDGSVDGDMVINSMPGVSWTRMPHFVSPDDWAINEANADAYWHWEAVGDVDTGEWALIVTPEDGSPFYAHAYNVYDPPGGLQGSNPGPGLSTAVRDNATIHWAILGGPGGFPFWGNTGDPGWSAGAQFRMSHVRVDSQRIGPPAGFAASYSVSSPVGVGYAYDPGGFSVGQTFQEE